MILDKHNRRINYLRLSVTDKCNLRCTYCMPAQGLNFLSKKQVLSFEEMLRLCYNLAELGIQKIRITGGEPFVRKDLIYFLQELKAIPGIEKVAITTNGVLTKSYIPDLIRLGIKDINLSLDTLDRDKFAQVTRRDELPAVLSTMQELLKESFNLSINTVFQSDKTLTEIEQLVGLAKEHKLSMRFIEEMPFNGSGSDVETGDKAWHFNNIKKKLKALYPEIRQVQNPPNSTSMLFEIPGYKGNIGIIPAFTRTICGSCNRVRITAAGKLKTCLYDKGEFDLKAYLRDPMTSDEALKEILTNVIFEKYKNGFEAEEKSHSGEARESMSTIGG